MSCMLFLFIRPPVTALEPLWKSLHQHHPNKPDVSVVQICTFHAIWCNLKGPKNVFCAQVTRNNARHNARAEMMHSLVGEGFRWARRCGLIPTEVIPWGSYIGFCVSIAHLPLFHVLGKTCYKCHLVDFKTPSAVLVGLLGINATEIITAMDVFRPTVHWKPLLKSCVLWWNQAQHKHCNSSLQHCNEYLYSIREITNKI